MILGAIISGLLHLGLVAVLLIGLPSLFPPEEFAAPIPVELVTVEELEIEDAPQLEPELAAEDTPPDSPPPSAPPPDAPQQQALLTPADDTPPAPEPDVEPAPLAVPEPAVEPEPEPVVPESPEPQPEQTVEPEPEPELEAIPEEIVQPEPDDEPEETVEPEPEIAERRPPTPRRKPKVEVAKAEPKRDEPPEEKPAQDRLASILKNVEKLREPPAPDNRNRTETEPSARQPSRIQQDQMVRAIQKRLRACWRLEPGARNAENLAVRVTVHFKPDGTVQNIQFADSQRLATDNFFRSAAENARRAILNCQPFNLPVREYFVWQRVNLNFDPRRMFGG